MWESGRRQRTRRAICKAAKRYRWECAAGRARARTTRWTDQMRLGIIMLLRRIRLTMAAAKQEHTHTLAHTQLRRTPRHMLQHLPRNGCAQRGACSSEGVGSGAALLRQMCAAASRRCQLYVFATLIEWENVQGPRVLRELHLRPRPVPAGVLFAPLQFYRCSRL